MDPSRMLGVRVARALYGRWRALGPAARERLAPLAEDAKRAALEARGASDARTAQSYLRSTSQTLAAGIVESAEADPEVDELEVRRLREDLKRELDRLSSAELQAFAQPAGSRTGRLARNAGVSSKPTRASGGPKT